jgi:hypothetical protein
MMRAQPEGGDRLGPAGCPRGGPKAGPPKPSGGPNWSAVTRPPRPVITRIFNIIDVTLSAANPTHATTLPLSLTLLLKEKKIS